MFKRRERGFTMVVALLAIVAMMAMGLAGAWMATMNTEVAINLNARQQAWNAANAGIQHARNIMANYFNNPTTCAGVTTGETVYNCVLASHSNTADEMPTQAAPNNKGAVVYDGAAALANLQLTVNGRNLGSYTVWARNDPADIAQGFIDKDHNSTVIFHVEGRDPGNTATVVLEGASQVSQTGVAVLPNLAVGRNVDQWNSNSTSGAVQF